MICLVLGYDSDEKIDMIILGFLRAFLPPTTQVMVKFYIAQFISKYIHEQLNIFPLNKDFCFQSYLVHLFIFQRLQNFQSLYLETENEVGDISLVINST
jgi:hypothetical protein